MDKKITKDMIISDVINENPELVRTFFENGMMCIAALHPRERASSRQVAVHGIDADQLVEALNAAL